MDNYKLITLDNGRKLYLYNNSSLKQVYAAYTVAYGSNGKWFNFELDGKKYHVEPGYAHYLEHLLIEHSKNGNILENYSKRNYSTNAYTYMDHTTFFFKGRQKIRESLKELIEMVDLPVFTDQDVEDTRHAIEEEATMASDNQISHSYTLTKKNLYKGFDVYDNTLCDIGNRETTKKITTEMLKICYDAFYSDENKALIIAGNFNEKELISYLNEIYKNIPEHKSRVVLPNLDKDTIRQKDEIIYRDIGSNLDTIAFKIKKPDNYSLLDLMYFGDIIFQNIFANNCEFINKLKEENILENINCISFHIEDDYLCFINTVTTSNREDYYKAIIDKLNARDITRKEFELSKKVLIADEILYSEDKYEPVTNFDSQMHYTSNYTDLDYLLNLTYEKFMDMYNQIDLSNYITTSVKKRRKYKYNPL